jgi:hypothetical protein
MGSPPPQVRAQVVVMDPLLVVAQQTSPVGQLVLPLHVND